MKTAMQELMEKVQSINERYELKDDANWLMNEIIDLIENSFEKEKEQIIEARDGRETSSFTTGKDYYDLNFNHHIEPEPNAYTNFTPHNANAVAEYNEGLKNFTPSDKAILLTPNGTLTIGQEYSSPSISFYKNNEVEDVVTIHYSKFKYKGEEVKDLQTIYNIISKIILNQNK